MTPGEQPQAAQNSPQLRPPDSAGQVITNTSGKRNMVWVALSLVVVLGLLVLLLLPKLVSQNNAQPIVETPTPTPVTETGLTPANAPVPESSRRSAEKALQEFLLTRARLELANAAAWGDPEWSQALEGAARGNHLFGQRQFSMATEALVESLSLLELLESESGTRLSNAIDSGWQALQANDSEAASMFFTTALSIDATNEDALNGLERAGIRPELLHLMAAGEQALSTGDLQDARAAYLEATELDGVYEPAAIALQAVNQQLRELAFNDAMSRALSALDTGQLALSAAALREAGTLKPGDEAVLDTRQLLQQAQQKSWLDQQRQNSVEFESDENWSAAAATYRKVLARLPQAAFARRGLAFAQDRERLNQQLDHYLSDPTRIYSPLPRANAEKLITSAGTPPATEPRLAGKIHSLQNLLTQAQTPLTVTLQSDGMTNVQIYHVGQLGQFTSQQLELRPGTYTVVGSRSGYRDVRQTFTVKPGSSQPVLDIRCEETV